MALAGAVEPPLSPSAGLDLDYLDYLLQGFYCDDLFHRPDPATTAEGEKCVDSPSRESIASSDPVYCHLEVEEDDAASKGFYVDDFLSDLFDLGSRDAETPNPGAAIDGEGKDGDKEEEDEEPASKKLKSDSAMKSRVMKAVYLKDKKDLDTFAPKQESAVLFEESLPLGSLLCLVSIICSFLLPVLGDQNLKNTKGQGRGNCHEIVMNGGVKNTILGFGSGNFGRRCRVLGIQTRFRSDFGMASLGELAYTYAAPSRCSPELGEMY
ncbi:hypothetical protein ZIOFF_001239 [Zingiber officinale]|uniref:Uncharacterized protein n=1 Tax=Zingiber officinale TaxID=94328 RepID=A0A8J5M783_ZINOF|nr:hypothetical protein ZIOFF_001239 [Zingiber officinale]